jgi:23S rRNA (pseudouridine1915-N3)-methyltransferase
MMKLIAVGKLKEHALEALVAEYAARLKPFVKLQLIEVKDEPNFDDDARNAHAMALEAERILRAIDPKERVVLLDVSGQDIDSIGVSALIESAQVRAQKLCFVIGGSLGVDARVRERADLRWSLSSNTFPHGLVRVMVLEQIYRGFKILHRQNYHK